MSTRPIFPTALVALLTCAAPSLPAQLSVNSRVSNLAANAAISAVIAGARSLIGGRGLAGPVLLGAIGGALQGAGRQVAGGGATAAGLIGRELSAAGISLAYSVAADSLVIIAPFWLVTIEVRPHAEDRVRARVNVTDAALFARSLADDRSRLDFGATLSTGAPVFFRPRSAVPDVNGYSEISTIYVVSGLPTAERDVVLRHEAVHLLQWDAYNQLAASPLERMIVRRFPGGATVSRFVDVGLLGPAVAIVLANQIRYDGRPWEREAYLLSTGRPTAGAK